MKDQVRQQKDKNVLTFPIIYNSFNQAVVKSVLMNFTSLQRDPLIGKAFPRTPIISWRRGRNLRDMLVFTRVRAVDIPDPVGTFKCPRKRCVTCKQTNPDPIIVGPTGFVRPRHKFDCNSDHVIYVISCDKCGSIYVGQTFRTIRERFLEHRSNVNHYKNHPDAEPRSQVAVHFNLPGHSKDNMKISGIYYIMDDTRREVEEDRLIARLGSYRAECMNIDFHYLNVIYRY